MSKERAGGGWKKTLSNGKEVISLQIGDKRYSMWVNDYKKEPKQPDYTIYLDDYVKPEVVAEKPVVAEPENDLPF